MISTLLALSLAGQPHPSRPLKQPRAAQAILAGAKAQLVNPAVYDASYQRLAYPMGDVPPDRGACSDVVVRALRNAGYDLQRLIFEDMPRTQYPREGKRRDRNIDHRRVANQRHFFRRFGLKLGLEDFAVSQLKPGDFVTWRLPNNLDHIGIVSDKKSGGRPLLIHNIRQAAEEDILFAWTITGHYRFPK